MPTNSGIKKLWYVYSVIKKNEILPYATKLSQLETILLSEVSQSHTFSVKQLIHLHQIVCVCVCASSCTK